MTRTTSISTIWGVALLVLALSAAGCSRQAKPGDGSLVPPFLDTPVAARPTPSAATVEKGRALYTANCIQCHGPNGDGQGYGAPFLVPSPRDFTSGQFKFRTTASGLLPSDEDLFRTISRGANGTGMPPWQYLLSAEDRWALVDYVKTFSPKFAARRPRRRRCRCPHAPGVVARRRARQGALPEDAVRQVPRRGRPRRRPLVAVDARREGAARQRARLHAAGHVPHGLEGARDHPHARDGHERRADAVLLRASCRRRKNTTWSPTS